MDKASLAAHIGDPGPWLHNINLGCIQRAPEHFLGDYPHFKYVRFRGAISADLMGRTALNIGCNADFYPIEMKRRGATPVLGIDTDEHYLRQARFAAEVKGAEIEFPRMSLWDIVPFNEPINRKTHFIEQRDAHEATNWWVPKRACVEAMLRSSRFSIGGQPEDEVYVCRWLLIEVSPDGPHCVRPAQGGKA